ncbi:HAMP domain-containing sensor histidine kinase [Asticcacaulis excentricus]|uniref:histidine kinase n=1 Tax=Asticcacaulis excentricus (strain ATCC 15261 / DSM 4724 / KCTC 12464 / NCIMB 9791 / VKM B-1370 / CB 48) TaxID=573065 RepID=E8RS57_ASTEC|nr:HAMP domain-containing sensor histidine kinase [Asticcacaulis excentricus]ADU14328.1 integral membrane sensor signal transduction histidine kinase [Asticcacaulis excentricus CB 48]
MKIYQLRRFPLRVQVLGLTLLSIVVAQGLTLLAVSFAPVLPPPEYHQQEVIDALLGKQVETNERRPLIKRIEQKLPSKLSDPSPLDTELAQRIAETAGMAPSHFKLKVYMAPPAMISATTPMTGLRGLPPGPPPPVSGGPPPNGPLERSRAGIFTEFIAARALPDGRWVIVEPAPEREWVRRLLFWILGGLIIMAPLAWVFSNRITAPIQKFAEAAETLGKNPAAPQMTLQGPAEIGQAAEAFNRMQTRLNRYVGDRTSMFGAISHDLRTPLTRMRFKLDRLEPSARDSLLNDVRHMELMISGVLSYLKDAESTGLREPLDMTSVIMCAVDDIAETGGKITVLGTPPVWSVEGNSVALRSMVDNVVENAIKYGEEAFISIEVSQQVGRLIVEDAGPGLHVEDLERVFDPFYRCHKETEGTGLGLTGARTTARAHGGDIKLSAGPKGLRAEVTIPCI